MSETSSSGADTATAPEPSSRVSMTKPARGGLLGGGAGRGRAPRGPAPTVAVPSTITMVTAAMAVMILGTIARGVLLQGNTATLLTYVTDANRKAKKPSYPFDAVHAVYQLRQSALYQIVIFGIVLGLLTFALRRSRTASGSRWVVLVIFLYTMMPFYIVPTAGLPVSVKIAGVVIGVSSVAVLVLIFVPTPSKDYFRACRVANQPEGAAATPRPGLGSLFGPKRPRDTAAARTPAPSADRTAPKAKAKVRNDTDAIAKGAELARSRAKAASKSRRTTD